MAKHVLLTSLVSTDVNASPGDVIEGMPAALVKKYSEKGTVRNFKKGDEGRRVKQWKETKTKPEPATELETEPNETEEASS